MPLNTFQFDTLTIDAVAFASQGNAVLGIRDSGKSYTATELAENLFEAGIPFVAFDPIGVWRFLRQPAAGRGYPIVVAGGQHGDIPLTPATAPDIVRAAMQARVSLVIDLYDMKLSKADWRRIVESCVRVMLYENGDYGLRHVFIEEAAEFAPQRPSGEQGMVFAEVEKLARMGRNARLGYTLINQRPEDVAKSVLELCDNLFLHRQKGRHSITALSKWMDAGAIVGGGKAVADTLSTLPSGECWAWMAGSETPVRIKVPRKNSFHPDARATGVLENPTGAPADASAFVKQMLAALPKIEAVPAKASGKTAVIVAPAPSAEALAEARHAGHVAGYKKGHAEGMRVMRDLLRTRLGDLIAGGEVDLQGLMEGDGAVVRSAPKLGAQTEATENRAAVRLERNEAGDGFDATPLRPPPKPAKIDRVREGLGPAATRLMLAFKRYPVRGLTWEEACIVAGMLPGNGYFYGGRKELLASGELHEGIETDRLYAQADEQKPLTRAEFKAIWGSRKQPAPRMFDALCEAAGTACQVSKVEASQRRSASRRATVSGTAACRNCATPS